MSATGIKLGFLETRSFSLIYERLLATTKIRKKEKKEREREDKVRGREKRIKCFPSSNNTRVQTHIVSLDSPKA